MPEEIAPTLQQAVQHHQAGDLQAAEPLYRRVLEIDPEHLDGCYLLGTLQLQLGRFADAVPLLRQVADRRSDVPDAHNNLGIAYKALGDWESAVGAFRRAVEIDSQYDQAAYNLGTLLEGRDRPADAERFYRHVLRLKPGDEQTLRRLAGVLKSQQKWTEAEECYRTLSAGGPQSDLQVELAFVLVQQERLDEAAEIYRGLLQEKPDFYQIHSSLSYIHERQGRLDEAVDAARRSVDIAPDYADGYNNLGTALRSLHRLDEAAEAFGEALEKQPEFPLAEFNYGTTRLLQGRYRDGWPGYNRCTDLVGESRQRAGRRWDGRPIAGQRLLVYADQGFGDTIQFVRFLPLVKDRSGADIVFECQAPLKELLSNQRGVDQLVADDEPQPAYGFSIPLAHLPGLLGIEMDSIPADVPYISAPEARGTELQTLLDGLPANSLKVGLVWQGNPRQARDAVRSCPFRVLLPLMELDGVAWVSLQTEEAGLRQLAEVEEALRPVDVGSRLQSFSETAAVLKRLDLLITVDTAAAHLAGALGRPVWTLLSHTPDWRWLLDRSDSPWYPTMRLFRQPRWGDWPAVVEQVAEELESFS